AHSMQNTTSALSKVPAVTAAFWLTKIAATTLGETGGDGRNFTERRGSVLHRMCSGTARQGQDPE
ncbi:hypothetical protein AUM92_21125, partial [Cronobacter sakazakii]